MWLNLHGCQAVQRKLIKRGKRTKKYIFTPFWAYIGQPDNHISLGHIYALLINLWNFGDNCSAFGGGWKTQLFWVGQFDLIFHKKKKLLYSYPNKSQINGYQGQDEILMITLFSSKKLGVYKITRNIVCTDNNMHTSGSRPIPWLWSVNGPISPNFRDWPDIGKLVN